MLEQLARKHKQWLQIAYKLCKCKDSANDLVQDMYIKMHTINKQVDDGYIYFVIKSIFLDKKRKQKEYTTDSELIFNNLIEQEQTNKELILNLLEEATNELEPHEKIIMHFSSNLGLREFCRESGISINLVIKIKRKLKVLLWQKTQKYEELGMLSAKLQKQLESKSAKVVQQEKIF